jgi:DNA-binding CsgD family transcriptional regulator
MRVPPELEIYTFHVEGDAFALCSYEAIAPARVAALTPAERAVVAGVLDGKSNRDIARARGVSTRTVANQVASAFDKLGVRSRGELAARWR